MRILITGCSGLLGSYLAKAYVQKGGHKIYGITEVPDYTAPDIKVYHLDIRDRDRLFDVVETVKPELVFHLAAIANVGFSWKNPKLTYEVNFIGTSNLLEAVEKYVPNSRVLIMSTAELYGDQEKEYLDENLPTTARSPYALSKAAMEMLAELYIQSAKLNIITLRSFNFTGPGQDRKFVASDFSFQIARIEVGQEPVLKVGNLSAVRDISDVRDIARYLTVIAQKGKTGGTYNLCSGKSHSIRDLLDILLSLSNKTIAVVVDETKFRPIDIPMLMGDTNRLREFELYPEYSLEQTLGDLLDYWRKRLEKNPFF